MILIGQYDSPFVRRVAIAMRLYGVAFEHRPWSTFGDGDKIAPHNPLRRVPTLVLDSGQMELQVHESIGHAVELDRVLGMEEAFAGSSFLRPEDRGVLRYASPKVSITADATLSTSATTIPGVERVN